MTLNTFPTHARSADPATNLTNAAAIIRLSGVVKMIDPLAVVPDPPDDEASESPTKEVPDAPAEQVLDAPDDEASESPTQEVRDASAEEALEPSAEHKRGRGRPRQFAAYTLFALLATMYELIAAKRPVTWNEIFDSIWFRYNEKELKIIGLEDFRDPDRLAAMSPPADRHLMTENDRRRDAAKRSRVCHNEYQRLWRTAQTMFAAFDDTPLVANWSRTNRPTIKEVAEAAKNPDLLPKTDLKAQVIDALVAASIQHANDLEHPGTDLFDGLLGGYLGDLAFDETHHAASLGDQEYNRAPGNQMARIHAHSRAYKHPASMGITLAVAVSRPDRPVEVPSLCLGAALHHPTGGYGPGVIATIDAISRHGLRPPNPSNQGQYVVVDGGYTESQGLNEALNARRYGLVMKYAINRQVLFEVGRTNNEDGDDTPGIYLFNGRPLCPGMDRNTLNRRDFETPEQWTGSALLAHANRHATLKAGILRTSGRPKAVEGRKRGRQAADAKPQPAMQITATCPVVSGTARCALIAESDTDPDLAGTPWIPKPPTHLPIELRPRVCQTGEARINLPLPAFKTWQEFMPGTWEHEDWYTAARSANERFNSILKRPNGGGNLHKGNIAPMKAAPVALAIAMSIAISNMRTAETWAATQGRRGNTKPPPPAIEARRKRAGAIRAYQQTASNRRVGAERGRGDPR